MWNLINCWCCSAGLTELSIFVRSQHYILSLSFCPLFSQNALKHSYMLFSWCTKGLGLTEGHNFVHLSVQGPKRTALSGAVARLGQREVSLFTGSVNKLNNFISVSHSTQKPYYTYSIYILFVHKITFTFYINSFMHFFCFSFSFLSQFSSVIFISKSTLSLNAFACPFQK